MTEVRIQFKNIPHFPGDGGQDTIHEHSKTDRMEVRIQYMNIIRQRGWRSGYST